MKLVLKNSSILFKKQGIVPGVYDTKDFCENGGLYKIDVIPLVLTSSSNWGYADFVPVSSLGEVNVACCAHVNCPGILYFSAKDLTTYLGYEDDGANSLSMHQFDSFNPPAGAQYAIIQSYIGTGYYQEGSTITLV